MPMETALMAPFPAPVVKKSTATGHSLTFVWIQVMTVRGGSDAGAGEGITAAWSSVAATTTRKGEPSMTTGLTKGVKERCLQCVGGCGLVVVKTGGGRQVE